MRRQAILLGLLACAFLGRVLGQVAVALLEPDWLPPMQDWYSGLLPYSILLLIQVAYWHFRHAFPGTSGTDPDFSPNAIHALVLGSAGSATDTSRLW